MGGGVPDGRYALDGRYGNPNALGGALDGHLNIRRQGSPRAGEGLYYARDEGGAAPSSGTSEAGREVSSLSPSTLLGSEPSAQSCHTPLRRFLATLFCEAREETRRVKIGGARCERGAVRAVALAAPLAACRLSVTRMQ